MLIIIRWQLVEHVNKEMWNIEEMKVIDSVSEVGFNTLD